MVKKPWQVTFAVYTPNGTDVDRLLHRRLVCDAVEARLPVPAEVLAEYPEVQNMAQIPHTKKGGQFHAR